MGLEDQVFQMKFTARQLERLAKKSEKDAAKEKKKVKKAIEKKNVDGARIYAQSAIRKEAEALNYLRIASRVDGVASYLGGAAKMNMVTKTMAGMTKSLEKALKSMNMEKVSTIMDRFESAAEATDVKGAFVESAMQGVTAATIDQDDVDKLINKVADANNLEWQQEVDDAEPVLGAPQAAQATPVQQQDELAERFARLKDTN